MACVNALKGATLISTALIVALVMAVFCNCVNALKGATLISTEKGEKHEEQAEDVSMP